METPFIVIQGTKGKASTVKYLSYSLHQLLNLNVLTYETDETKKNIIRVNINNKFDVNLTEIRKDIKNFEYENDYVLLDYLIVIYSIDVVVCIYNLLIEYYNVIACGLTTIEYDESQNIDYSVKLLTENCYNFLRKDVPLVVCPYNKPFNLKLFEICYYYQVPIVMTSFFHLKYINFDTRIESRYSYINLAIALTLNEIFYRCINNKKFYKDTLVIKKPLEMKQFNPLEYKQSLYATYPFKLCPYPKRLPNFKNLNFGYEYAYVNKINPNLVLYSDAAGSYKSSNLLIDWFNTKSYFYQNSKNKNIKICIFSCDTNVDLVKTLLPLTNIDFDTFFVVDYGEKGRSYDTILSAFENPKNIEHIYIDDNDYSWTETIYEILNIFYNDNNYVYGRRRASLRLNEYEGLEEFANENIQDLSHIRLPFVPNIIVDDIKSIIEWIFNLIKNNKDKTYHILITGQKKLIKDFYQRV